MPRLNIYSGAILMSLILTRISLAAEIDDVGLLGKVSKIQRSLKNVLSEESPPDENASIVSLFERLGSGVKSWISSISSTEIGWKTIGSDLDGDFYYDAAGGSVAINGDGSRVAVGAPNSFDGNGDVKVYDWDYSLEKWDPVGIPIVGSSNDNSGSSLDMSSSGSRIIIGSPLHQNYYGTTRVYDFDAVFNAWVQKGADIDGDERYDEGGAAVSISGNGLHVAIGAPDNTNKMGQVRIFFFDDGNANDWVQVGQSLMGEDYYTGKGNSVSLNYDGTVVVVGSSLFDVGTSAFAGSAVVWEYDDVSEQWSKMGSTILGDSTYYELFGHSVDINHAGDRVVVGAVNGDEDPITGFNTGMVQVYEFTNNDWEQVGNDIFGSVSGDNLGSSISMNGAGDRIVAGAPYADEGDYNVGQAIVFDYDLITESWVQVGDTILGECTFDQSGESVAISDDGVRVIVGAPFNEYYAGHGRVYEAIPGFVDYDNDHCFTVPQPTPDPTIALTPAPTTIPPTMAPNTSSPTELSASPSTAPTTSAPSPSPTEVCESSPLEFELGGYDLDCDWVGTDPITNCAYTSGVATHCPKECSACDTERCSDSTLDVYYKNSLVSCTDLQGLPGDILANFCDRYNDVMLTCRDICNYCSL